MCIWYLLILYEWRFKYQNRDLVCLLGGFWKEHLEFVVGVLYFMLSFTLIVMTCINVFFKLVLKIRLNNSDVLLLSL